MRHTDQEHEDKSIANEKRFDEIMANAHRIEEDMSVLRRDIAEQQLDQYTDLVQASGRVPSQENVDRMDEAKSSLLNKLK